jgi:hypothetical protein
MPGALRLLLGQVRRSEQAAGELVRGPDVDQVSWPIAAVTSLRQAWIEVSCSSAR